MSCQESRPGACTWGLITFRRDFVVLAVGRRKTCFLIHAQTGPNWPVEVRSLTASLPGGVWERSRLHVTMPLCAT